MQVLYFAWLRERIGLPREQVLTTAPTVIALIEELKAREERYALAFSDLKSLRVALDQKLSSFDAPLAGVREVAFFPPMTGADMRLSVQEAAFDAGAELNAFSAAGAGAGAVVSFTGIVRDSDGILQAMEIEHYPGMTEAAIADIIAQAQTRWSLTDVLVIHRYGKLEPGAQIMMVATASRHRIAAFESAEFLMDYLKSRAPFWKKEIGRDGATWVAAKDEDEAALGRW